MSLTAIPNLFRGLAAGFVLIASAAPQAAQAAPSPAPKVLIGIAGGEFGNGKSFTNNSGAWGLIPATTYYYKMEGNIRGTGALSSAIPLTSIPNFLNSLKPGTSALLKGSVQNPSKALPFTVVTRKISGSRNIPNSGKVQVTLTVELKVLADGLTVFTVKGVSLTGPAGKIKGGLRFGSNTRIVVSTKPL